MGEIKAPTRGVDLSHVDEDPFADLADFFDAEMAQGSPLHHKSSAFAASKDGAHAPHQSRRVETPAFDDDFEQAFADVFAEDADLAPLVAEDRRNATTASEGAMRSYSNWVAPGATSQPQAPRIEQPVSLHTTRGPARDSDLNQALRGLSAPAKPRQGIVFETQSFAPERVDDSYEQQPAQVELDEFDQLIASELAMMKDDRRAPTQGASAFYASDAYDEAPDAAQRDASGDYFDDEDAADAQPRPSRGAFRRNMVALGGGVASLALVGAVGLFMWAGGASDRGATGTAGPLLIKADAQPYKVEPTDPGGRTIPNQNKAVYERVAASEGQSMPQPTQQSLLTESEEPIDLPSEEPPAYENLPGVDIAGSDNDAAPDDARLADAGSSVAAPVGVLQPRKVRTMVVRPDGTLVPAEPDAMAPKVDATSPASAAQSVAMPGIIEVSSPPRLNAAVAEPTSAAEPASTEPALASAPAPAARPPVPQAAPVDAPAQAAAPRQVASADPTETATIAPAKPAAPLASGGYFVQISSQPSQSLAQQSLKNLTGRYSNVIAGRSVGIQSAEIPGKGTFYRVRVAAASKDDASALCGQLKSAGGNCFVAR